MSFIKKDDAHMKYQRTSSFKVNQKSH